MEEIAELFDGPVYLKVYELETNDQRTYNDTSDKVSFSEIEDENTIKTTTYTKGTMTDVHAD